MKIINELIVVLHAMINKATFIRNSRSWYVNVSLTQGQAGVEQEQQRFSNWKYIQKFSNFPIQNCVLWDWLVVRWITMVASTISF